MPVPYYKSIMLPLLKCAADDQTHKFRELIKLLAQKFKLTEEGRRELITSGTQP